jgi:hypothetical protein
MKGAMNVALESLLTDAGLTDWFSVETGTRQGGVLSPYLFSLVISPLVDEFHARGMCTGFGDLRIACLLFVFDIVLIAEPPLELQAMMDVASSFFRRWRFLVSAGQTRVIGLGHRETRDLKDRYWCIGGRVVQDVASYTYLEIEFDKSGNWFNALQRNVGRCKKSMSHLDSLTDISDQGLNVGQLSELWGLFARPRLL